MPALPEIILFGYPGSQKIVKASSYLTRKYLPMFKVEYINYKGDISLWAEYVAFHLKYMTSRSVILGLDDYLVSGPIDMDTFLQAEAELQGDVVCIKLCQSTEQEHEEYPVTTQYTLWNREYLVWLLSQVHTPWEFEVQGSKIFNKTVLLRTCIPYYTNSAISSRWQGINYTGLKESDLEIIKGMDSKVVVFGGSGFLGINLIERLLSMGYNDIVSVSRNEGAAVALNQKFPSVSILVGDIAEPSIVREAMTDARQVYLASAMKHVGLAEANTASCVRTNILGTMNVIEQSFIDPPSLFVFISSDKAAQASGVYGCSKRIGESLMMEAERINPKTAYRTVRYGNILYSSGSVLCKWRDKMQTGQEVTITEPDATRFFWSVSQAIDLILECIENAKDASPYVTAMKSIRMGDLLEAMMQKFGRVPVKTIGLQSGENRHEIITPELPDSMHSERYTTEEIVNLI